MSAAKRPSAGQPTPDPGDDSPVQQPESTPAAKAAGDPVIDEVEAISSDDPDAVLVHQHTPVASLDELRAAMQWAFENEDITPGVLDQFAQHARLVLQGNQRMNLTAIVEPREVAAKHYLDSWRATRLLPLVGRTVLDLGTGAGFPGMPVALAEPQTKLVLLDSTRKRVDFVKETLTALGMTRATATWERGEDHLARHRYDMVLMRAVSSVRENVRLLRKVKHSHKDLLMLKGASWSREVRAAEREAERLGFRLDTVWEHKLPGDLGARAILVYRAPGGQGN
ncbi:MAG TPA: 16S rRNA (guanine(527)-N(7))-methyltransferase RsmG [Planctomycetota bacterium]|nr:16S rRNA (guanine(527)-N(7))-methyltransferase RsmG [Planctomycetota bacterium]